MNRGGSALLDRRRGLLRLLLLILLRSCRLLDFNQVQASEIFGLLGKNITLVPPFKFTGGLILWWKDKDVILDWTSSDTTPVFEGILRERASLDTSSGSLTIPNLKSKDQGLYKVAFPESGKAANWSLLVVRSLPEPTMNCIFANRTVVVRCQLPEVFHFRLTSHWEAEPPRENLREWQVEFSEEEALEVERLQCIVSNPRSTNRSSILPPACIVAESFPRHRFVLIIIPVFLVACLTLGILYLQRKRSAAWRGSPSTSKSAGDIGQPAVL
ncbi:lymphocyte function-associated antigen 3 [Tachyglossus aculeatus]|uniref:lymphocyte function-associated antigen 3 n=1 Tax=Tachyglossus aculeatus TaxID=9261 RepID=UPI0018F45405|nr:lymphocyte function-associated antigen 3 [Tachyglossus aculeatus]